MRDGYQHRLLSLAKYLITEGELKSFHDQKKLQKSVATKPGLQRILKGFSLFRLKRKMTHSKALRKNKDAGTVAR